MIPDRRGNNINLIEPVGKYHLTATFGTGQRGLLSVEIWLFPCLSRDPCYTSIIVLGCLVRSLSPACFRICGYTL